MKRVCTSYLMQSDFKHPLCLGVLTCCMVWGCDIAKPLPTKSTSEKPPATSNTSSGPKLSASVANPKSPVESEPAQSETPTLAKLLTQLEDAFTKKDLSQAEQFWTQLVQIPLQQREHETARLVQLKDKLETLREEADDIRRQQALTDAQKAVIEGNLDRAAELVENVLNNAPTMEQSEAAARLLELLTHVRQAREKMTQGMKLLASTDRNQQRQAQDILWSDPDVAIPLLLEASRSDQIPLVINSLELLGKFRQPQRTTEGLVAVLGRPSQKAAWPAVLKELQRAPHIGAGPHLLKLYQQTKTPESRQVALQALSLVSDPPPETFLTLLPRLTQDGPLLSAELSATYRAVTAHRQVDWATRRGLPFPITKQQEELLDHMPARLDQLLGLSRETEKNQLLVWEAQRLATVTRHRLPGILPGVKVLRTQAEISESPAGAILDGVWNSTKPETMWRHPSKRLTSVVLDLGTERTVTGVCFWNGNEAGANHRGWKDVEIFVGDESFTPIPTVTGMIPMAPSTENPADYGLTILVPFAVGRYVRLQMVSVWRDDGLASLSEVRVMGY